jgi:hypothetical protein
MRFLPLISLPLLASAANLEFFFQPSEPLLTNPSLLPSSTRATLSSSGPALTAPISSSNTIQFSAVPPGSYLLSVFSRDHRFENLRVDVLADGTTESVIAWTTWRGNEWDNKGEVRGEGEAKAGENVKIEVKVAGSKVYYQQRAGCEYLDLSLIV